MSTISVIIPVHNTAPLLHRCMHSVLIQSHSDLEIIVINDYSTDNSAQILDKYAKNDCRITIINHDSNKGLSAARNTGIKHAHGEYIYFLDSDDWIESTYLEHMYLAAFKSGSNIINNINVLREYSTGEQQPFFFGNLSHDCSGFIPSNQLIYNIMWASWTHLFRRDFLQDSGISFPEGLIYEDMYFQPISYMSVDQVYVTHGPAYHYWIRPDGICGATQLYTKYRHYFSILELVYDAMHNKHYFENHDVLLFPENFLLPLQMRPDDALLSSMQTYYAKALPFIKKNQHLYSEEDIRAVHDILLGKIPDEKAFENHISKDNILNMLRKRVRFTENKK